MNRIQDIIRALREDNDYTQSIVAAKLGISQQYYSKYETGEYELPIRHLITLAGLYHVSLDYLAGISTFSNRPKELEAYVADGVTAGQLMNDILALSPDGKSAVADYVALQKLKQKAEK